MTREDFMILLLLLFIPAILNRMHNCADELRDIFTLPPKFGGLGIPRMTDVADSEYQF